MSEKYEVIMSKNEYDLLASKIGKKDLDILIDKTIQSLSVSKTPLELLFIAAFHIGALLDFHKMGSLMEGGVSSKENDIKNTLEATMTLLLQTFLVGNNVVKDLKKHIDLARGALYN